MLEGTSLPRDETTPAQRGSTAAADPMAEYQAALDAFGAVDPHAHEFVSRHKTGSHGDVDLWPENHDAWQLFECMQTQWRTANGVVIGLDYGPLSWVCPRVGIEPQNERRVFQDLRVMEDEALAWFDEQTRKD